MLKSWFLIIDATTITSTSIVGAAIAGGVDSDEADGAIAAAAVVVGNDNSSHEHEDETDDVRSVSTACSRCLRGVTLVETLKSKNDRMLKHSNEVLLQLLMFIFSLRLWLRPLVTLRPLDSFARASYCTLCTPVSLIRVRGSYLLV